MQGQSPTCYGSTRPRNRHHDPEERAAILAAAAEGCEAPAAAELAEPPNPVA